MPDIEFLAADLADATAALPAAAALFVKTGRAVRSHAGPIGAGEGAYAPRGAVVTADAGSVVWIWLVGRGLPAELQGLRVVRRAHAPFDHGRCLLRFDRIDFPPGGETPRHTHAGPGLRRLLAGRLGAEIGDRRFVISPGEGWLERGPDPVIGRSLGDEPASFLRLLALPPDMRGKSSYRAWDRAEATRTNPVSYRLFFEEDIDLPA
jgi:hypothetical protein